MGRWDEDLGMKIWIAFWILLIGGFVVGLAWELATNDGPQPPVHACTFDVATC